MDIASARCGWISPLDSGTIPRVSIYSDNSGQPGSSLKVLTNPSTIPTTNTEVGFGADDYKLDPSTSYWIVLERASGSGFRECFMDILHRGRHRLRGGLEHRRQRIKSERWNMELHTGLHLNPPDRRQGNGCPGAGVRRRDAERSGADGRERQRHRRPQPVLRLRHHLVQRNRGQLRLTNHGGAHRERQQRRHRVPGRQRRDADRRRHQHRRCVRLRPGRGSKRRQGRR